MTQASSSGSVVEVKAKPNVYSVLLIAAIVILLVAVGIVLRNLMAPLPDGPDGYGYGMTLGEIIKGGIGK